MSESEKKIEDLPFRIRFLKLVSELKAPKGQWNKFGKYNYRNAEDILEAVKPLASKYFIIPNLTDEITTEGDWHYVKSKAAAYDALTDEHIESSGFARESLQKKGMDDSQITGTASSYARKYALNGLFLIDDTKDADSDEFKNEREANSPKKITKVQAEAMWKKIENLSGMKGASEGKEVLPTDLADTLTKKKFLEPVVINDLDTEQYVTLNRYLDELEIFYKKK